MSMKARTMRMTTMSDFLKSFGKLDEDNADNTRTVTRCFVFTCGHLKAAVCFGSVMIRWTMPQSFDSDTIENVLFRLSICVFFTFMS